MDKKRIGNFIVKLRKEKNISQQELADKLFIDRSAVSKWERGISTPNSSYLLELSKIFDVRVNELLMGEKIDSKNINKSNEITINLLNSKKKFKIGLIVTIVLFFLSLLLYFTYYFFINYNSLKVYMISGTSENYYTNDGIIVISREKGYIKLGEIESTKGKKIDYIEIFYMKDNERKMLVKYDSYKDYSNSKLLINLFGYDELYSYNDLDYILNNLKIEITSGEEIEIINLETKQDFSNNKFFFKEKKNGTYELPVKKEEKEIPNYVKNNFVFDEEEDCYIKITKKDNKTIKEIYYYDVYYYHVFELNDDYEMWYSYDYDFNRLHVWFTDLNNDDNSYYYSYNYNKNECFDEFCDIDEVSYFEEKYLKKFKS